MGRLSAKATPASKHKARTAAERKRRRRETLRRYESSPRGRYRQQKANAKRRGIPWQLTFLEWCELWEESGHWDDRGLNVDSYVMGRHGDSGPYKLGNVSIVPLLANVAECNKRRQAQRWGDPGDDWRHVHSAEGID